ncbi:YoaK family protein [Pseudomonas sp. SLFW]|uniref:YoaK family protein n=1 Tax=Pseudomonas sp. SLFW TaxID=2683259 RepID=UPI003531AF44
MLPEPKYSGAKARQMFRFRGRIGLCFVASLSFIAGMTDSISFMVTGDFVSFMSGNTTRLAASLSTSNFVLALHIALLVATFVVGNALGVIAATYSGRRSWPLLLCIGLLLCVGGFLGENTIAPILAVLAMGMINAVVEEVNGLPIGLTYVTGALSRFGRGLGRAILGQQRIGWRVQLVPWSGMLVGAIAGGTMAHTLSFKAMVISGVITLGVGIASAAIPRSWQSKYMPK